MGNYEAIFNLIGSILGGVIIGAFCGAISLIVGIIKKKKALGLIGFFVSIAFGIFMTTVLYQPAFLSIIPSAIFAGIIFILTKNQKRTDLFGALFSRQILYKSGLTTCLTTYEK